MGSSSTEESVSDLVAEVFRKKGINAQREISYTGENRGKPDLEVVHSGETFLGEAKWENKKWEGFGQARDYGEYSDVKGSFLIIYPESLKKEIQQKRIEEVDPELMLSNYDFRAAFLQKENPTDMFRGDLSELVSWLKDNLDDEKESEVDSDEIIEIFDQMVKELKRDIEDVDKSADLFKTLLGGEEISSDLEEVAERGSAYLFLNQITFYHILSNQREKYDKVNVETLESPSDLQLYFNDVLEDDYNSVYGVTVSTYFSEDSIDVVKNVVRSIQGLKLETINLDILGKVFHRLIPYEIRKKVAAYYTKHEAAEILSDLAIESGEESVLDPACGSGTLLVSSYKRKKKLIQKKKSFSSDDHKKFLEQQIYGLDIMPFAGHLSTIHLALQAPVYLTDYVNIGIADSTKYHPEDNILPLTRVIPESKTQRTVHDFGDGGSSISDDTIEAGSINLDAMPDKKIELKKVDNVVMNPPFTRQESIADFSADYKDKLETRFRRYDSKINRRMSFCSYFLLLADKFLKEEGQIAAVLPASTLRKDSNKGVRQLLLDKYDIEAIVVRSDAPNFSEDTSLREILLVATKDGGKSDRITYYMIDDLDEEKSKEIKHLSRICDGGEVMSREGVEIRSIPKDAVDDNLFKYISCIDFSLNSIWNTVASSQKLKEFKEMESKISEGARSRSGGRYPEMSIYSTSEACQGKRDIWFVEEDEEESIKAKNRFTEDIVEIPKDSLTKNFRKMSERDYIDVSDLEEYVITGDFDDFELYMSLSDVEMDEYPRKWNNYVSKRSSKLAIPCKFRINSDNTHLLSYVSSEERVWTNALWAVSGFNDEVARTQAIWFNSTINLIQILIERAPVEGGWLRLDKYILEDFVGLNPEELTESEKEKFKSFYENMPSELPSLVQQIASNVDIGSLSDEREAIIKENLDLDNEDFEKDFSTRKELDKLVLDVLEVNGNKEDILESMYAKVLFELAKFEDLSS